MKYIEILQKRVQQQNLYKFRQILTYKCKQYGIELRVVSRRFPSSKICHECGNIKRDLKLSDRTYICDCGYVNDRDINAALNLKDCLDYKLA